MKKLTQLFSIIMLSFMTMGSIQALLVLFILSVHLNCSVIAFLPGFDRYIASKTVRFGSTNEQGGGIQSSTLIDLTDHDAEGERLARSIVGWLDEEVSG